MIALSWSATLSSCGHFLWLHPEPCSLCPVGLVRNWYFLLQPRKKNLSQTMVWFNNVTLLPINAPCSISMICWSTISLSNANANDAGECFWQLNCGVNTNRQSKTIMMKEAILVALMLNRGSSWPGSRNGYWPTSLTSRPSSGPQNRWRNNTWYHCHSQNHPIVLDGSVQQHAAGPILLDD